MKKFTAFILAAASLLLASCGGGEDVKLITFNVASMRGIDSGLAYTAVVMPYTGTRLIMNTETALYSGDIEEIHVAENQMPTGEKITGFYFFFNPQGARKLTNITAANIGSYIVMSYAGNPIGLRIIDSVITDGKLFVCSEFFDEKKTIHKLVDEMRAELHKVDKIKSDR